MLTTEVTVTDLPEEKKEPFNCIGGHDHGTGSQGMTRSKAQRIFLRAFFWGEDHWQKPTFLSHQAGFSDVPEILSVEPDLITHIGCLEFFVIRAQ